MSRVCELIGELSADVNPNVDRIVQQGRDKQETFYSIPLEIYGCSIRLLISEYSINDLPHGKVKVRGSLMSDFVRGQVPSFYFYTNSIEPVDADVELSNTVSFMGTVTKVKGATTDNAGRDLLPLVVSDKSPLNTTSILYVCLKGAEARENKGLQIPCEVSGEGYLKKYRDVYEINVIEFDVNS